jgi:hypothetical protein
VFEGIYQLPIGMLAGLTAIVFVGSYWIGCFLLRPLLRIFVKSKGGENSIVGAVLSAFGVLYGLLLSLIAVAAYQNVSKVGDEAAAEASALLALYRDVSEFSSPQNEELRSELEDYCRVIIEEEWAIQRKGRVPIGVSGHVRRIRKALLDFEPQSDRDRRSQNEALKHFEALTEHGRFRRYAAQASIPSVMWYVVIVGTLINFALMWLFDMKFVTQIFLGGLLAFFLGALILLIAVLERPYRSVDFGVSPQAHQMVLQVITDDRSASGTNNEGP